MLMNHFPVRKKLLSRQPVAPGVWQTKSGFHFVKRGSELHELSGRIEFKLSDYEGKTRKERWRKAVDDAKLHAKFYALLAREGFYHPKSFFVVAESKRGNPEIIAVMPALQAFNGRIPFDKQRQRKRYEKMLVLKKYLSASQIHADVTNHPFNWGEDGGQVYYHDLHLFQQKMPLELKESLEQQSKSAQVKGRRYEYLASKRGVRGREKARVDALAHKELLERMAEQGFYHPKTNFSVTPTPTGFAVQVMHPPDVKPLSLSQLTPALAQRIKAKKAILLNAGIKSTQLHDAIRAFNNWGMDENGEVYYLSPQFFRLSRGRLPKAIRKLTSFSEKRRETI